MSFTRYPEVTFNPVPLIPPPLNYEDGKQLNNVLLIDSSVKNYQTFVDSVNKSTYPIIYSTSSTKTELLTLLQTVFSGKSIDRICIVFASNLGNVRMFLDNKPLFVENESVPYSENLQFIIDIIKEFRVKNIDYLACDTLKYQKYLDYYRLLEQNTGVIVGASDDKTGNIKFGGDFVMESTSEDIETIYFTKSIEHYSFLLDNPPNIKTLKIIYDNNPNVYGLLTLDIANTVSIPPSNKPSWIYNFVLNINGTTFDSSYFWAFAYKYSNTIDYTQSNLLSQFTDFNFFTISHNPYGSAPFKFKYNNITYTVTNIFLFNPICFKEDTKILTNKGYQPIQNLRKGDMVKTLLHDYVPINMIGKQDFYHPAVQDKIKDQLYICNQKEYPTLFEPLVITGAHSILVDKLTDEQRSKAKKVNGDIFVTDYKYRLPVCVDDRSFVYNKSGFYTIYHLALDNDNYYSNYGIYANGLLVETCSKRYLKELSNMTLIN